MLLCFFGIRSVEASYLPEGLGKWGDESSGRLPDTVFVFRFLGLMDGMAFISSGNITRLVLAPYLPMS